MALWPWKSRPVVTPFTENYSGELLHIHDNPGPTDFDYQLPDDVYIIPSVISLRVITLAGLRATNPSSMLISRGGHIFSGCNFGTFINNQTVIVFLAANCPLSVPVAVLIGRIYPFPDPTLCYPNDIFTFNIPSLIPGDLIDHIHIHGKLWRTT